jgi:hypothetical protein
LSTTIIRKSLDFSFFDFQSFIEIEFLSQISDLDTMPWRQFVKDSLTWPEIFLINNCKEISEEVLEFLDSERFFWLRIILKYKRELKDFPKLWKPVIDKTPVAKVKQIAIAVSRFFKIPIIYIQDLLFKEVVRNRGKRWSLFEIAANHGDLALLRFIVSKIKLKNIRKTERRNALFLAASEGHLETYVFLSDNFRDKNPVSN